MVTMPVRELDSLDGREVNSKSFRVSLPRLAFGARVKHHRVAHTFLSCSLDHCY
jgi:hypothetical protein